MHFRDKVTFAGIKLRKAFDIADPNNMAKASLVWTKVIPFNPKNDRHSYFTLQWYCWIIQEDYENKGNDRKLRKLWL